MCGDQEEDSGDCGDRILTNERTVVTVVTGF